MKRTRQTLLKVMEDLSDQSGSEIEMDDSDKDKDYTVLDEVESESDIEINKSDQPSTSAYISKRVQKLKHAKIIKKTETETKRRRIVDSESLSSTSRQSKYSEHFTITSLPNNSKVGSCNLCKNMNIKTDDIKMSKSNTSGLKWHLKAKHPQVFASVFPSKLKHSSVQPKLDDIFRSKAKMVSIVNYGLVYIKFLI